MPICLKQIFTKIEFKDSIRKLSFLSHLLDIKIAWINPCCNRHSRTIKNNVKKNGENELNKTRIKQEKVKMFAGRKNF